MQQSFFKDDDIKAVVKSGLIISKKKQTPLNKQQTDFNRSVKRIEKLRIELKATTQVLDKQLAYYGKEIHPLEKELNRKRKEIVRVLFDQLKKNRKIKGEDKKILKRFLLSFLQDILSNPGEPPEQDLKDIFKELSGESYEEAVEEEFEIMKEQMQDIFRESGVNFDPGELNKDMTEAELAAKMKELSERLNEQEDEKQAKRSKRKKTAKQLEREAKNKEVEEVRNKNIKTIYKQLVRALHPDLEQDEGIKAKKEKLMQRLTVAYENNDLHEMLSLEMEFIHKEENNIDQLSSEKLAIYNQVLKEQIQELERQKTMLMQHPRFSPLMKYVNLSAKNIFDLKNGKKHLLSMNDTLDESLENLKGKSIMREINQIVLEYQISEFNFEEEEEDDESFWEWDEF